MTFAALNKAAKLVYSTKVVLTSIFFLNYIILVKMRSTISNPNHNPNLNRNPDPNLNPNRI